jgi:hypothetical protein
LECDEVSLLWLFWSAAAAALQKIQKDRPSTEQNCFELVDNALPSRYPAERDPRSLKRK